ncbi:acetoacetate decarboxylase family protein [Oryzihumus sp.]
MRFEVIRMPDSSGLGDYTESGQVLRVRHEGDEGDFIHSMYLDNAPAIALGREGSAYPKKLGRPSLFTDSDTLVGALDYGSLRVVGMGLHHPDLTIPLAVSSLYASANDRPTRRRAACATSSCQPSARPWRWSCCRRSSPPWPAPSARSAPSASAAGLQLLTMSALGQGMPAHGPGWLPAPLLVCGALPVLHFTGGSAVCRALTARRRRTAAPDPAVRHTAMRSRRRCSLPGPARRGSASASWWRRHSCPRPPAATRR